MNFNTRKEAIDYLVSEGKPLNFARAAMNESFNYDEFSPRITGTNENDLEEPGSITPEQAIMAYNTMEEMFSVEDGKILLDGEPLYDIEGFHLDYDSHVE